MASVTFGEPGSNATKSLDLWIKSGTVTSDTTNPRTGPNCIKYDSAVGNVAAYSYQTSVMADAGRRCHFAIRFDSLPTADTYIAANWNAAFAVVWGLGFQASSGKLFLTNAVGTVLGIDSVAVTTGVWYQIIISHTITSVSNYAIKYWRDPATTTPDISITQANGNLSNATGVHFALGFVSAPGASKVMRSSDILIDDGATLDFAAKRVYLTAKLPASNSTNTFDTFVGANPANRWTNVNERPLSVTNGWSQAGSGSATENYGIQANSAGDVDISAKHTQYAYGSWIAAKKGAGTGTGEQIFSNAAGTSIALTTSAAIYWNWTTSATYPTNPATGMRSTGGTADTFLYECGVVIVWLENVTISDVTTTAAVSQTVVSNVTTTAAVSQTKTSDVTSTAATSQTKTSDVTTTIAASRVVTSDVTTTAASSQVVVSNVTSTVAASQTKTSDVTSTAAVSRSANSDVTTSASVNQTVTSSIMTTVASSQIVVSNVTTTAASSRSATSDVTSTSATSRTVVSDVTTSAASSRSVTSDVTTTLAAGATVVTSDVTTSVAVSRVSSTDVTTTISNHQDSDSGYRVVMTANGLYKIAVTSIRYQTAITIRLRKAAVTSVGYQAAATSGLHKTAVVTSGGYRAASSGGLRKAAITSGGYRAVITGPGTLEIH